MIDTLLSRLDKPRRTGPGRWLACCPAHPDKSPSLSIRELDDGRMLIHCFAGCSVGDIVAAVGLTFQDLFPDTKEHRIPGERRPFNPMDVLKALAFESTVVLLAASDMIQVGDLVLGDDGFERLAQAHDRIQGALSLIDGERRYG